jgi:hypothetical protein
MQRRTGWLRRFAASNSRTRKSKSGQYSAKCTNTLYRGPLPNRLATAITVDLAGSVRRISLAGDRLASTCNTDGFGSACVLQCYCDTVAQHESMTSSLSSNVRCPRLRRLSAVWSLTLSFPAPLDPRHLAGLKHLC